MHLFMYADTEGRQYDISFYYDPERYYEDDPSQSPWNYILIEKITNSEGDCVEFDEDELHEAAEYLWKNYRYEF